MIRIALIILLAAILGGCTPTVVLSDQPRIEAADESWTTVRYAKHQYIRLNDGMGDSIAHDPDCPCGKEGE